jgi:hypothetical protein
MFRNTDDPRVSPAEEQEQEEPPVQMEVRDAAEDPNMENEEMSQDEEPMDEEDSLIRSLQQHRALPFELAVLLVPVLQGGSLVDRQCS